MTTVMRYAQPIVCVWVLFYRIFPQPSHHIPYLYSMAGAAFKSQERVREIALANYNNTPTGLSGVGPVPRISDLSDNRYITFRTRTVAR